MLNINITTRDEFDDRFLATSPDKCEKITNAGNALKTLNMHENPHDISRNERNDSIDR